MARLRTPLRRPPSPLTLAALIVPCALTASFAGPPQPQAPGAPAFFSGSLRALKVATLDLPQPLGTGPGETLGIADKVGAALAARMERPKDPLPAEEPLAIAPPPGGERAYLELALDIAMTLPGIDEEALAGEVSEKPAYGPDLSRLDGPDPQAPSLSEDAQGEAQADALASANDLGAGEVDGLEEAPELSADALPADALEETALQAPAPQVPETPPQAPQPARPQSAESPAPRAVSAEAVPASEPPRDAGEALEPLYRNPLAIFGSDPRLFPPLAFEHLIADDAAPLSRAPLPRARPFAAPAEVAPVQLAALSPANITDTPLLAERPLDEMPAIVPTPAQRLTLSGPARARAEKCLAEAIYFESRGEPKRGQIAVAQVVMNRVFSGYYPDDVCRTVYQNAHRRLACQFTFACDSVKDVVREPDMWVQAKEIAADMLDGKLWIDTVGRATHYHAYWVHPRWVREMRKLDRIGVHTFYRPRRWGEG